MLLAHIRVDYFGVEHGWTLPGEVVWHDIAAVGRLKRVELVDAALAAFRAQTSSEHESVATG